MNSAQHQIQGQKGDTFPFPASPKCTSHLGFSLGSIGFLDGQARLAAWPTITQQVESREKTPLTSAMNLVIMNPPFTTDSLRHDQFSQKDELAIKQREKKVLAGQPHRAAARLSGSANAFQDAAAPAGTPATTQARTPATPTGTTTPKPDSPPSDAHSSNSTPSPPTAWPGSLTKSKNCCLRTARW